MMQINGVISGYTLIPYLFNFQEDFCIFTNSEIELTVLQEGHYSNAVESLRVDIVSQSELMSFLNLFLNETCRTNTFGIFVGNGGPGEIMKKLFAVSENCLNEKWHGTLRLYQNDEQTAMTVIRDTFKGALDG